MKYPSIVRTCRRGGDAGPALGPWDVLRSALSSYCFAASHVAIDKRALNQSV
jgi:hypothetical protein